MLIFIEVYTYVAVTLWAHVHIYPHHILAALFTGMTEYFRHLSQAVFSNLDSTLK
jgi:hypothetical protein